ncbi:hypothetical protein B0H21DRAFT_809830 [Amylocystis lapponica]|nr:hypothetical protein B0H21DRAFT_809830 [Amylocystis lapponica]
MSHNTLEVSTSTQSAGPGPTEVIVDPNPDLYDIDRIQKDCPHFRILIMGRANAGKTTILQKVCSVSPDTKPIVYNKKGKQIKSSWFKKATKMRGDHNLEHQITYEDSAFIFHDSCGLEAGSKEELQRVQDFISERSSHTQLKEQLHAIWYCISLDNDRPVTSADEKFFKDYAGKAPVIVIFTKFEALTVKRWIPGDQNPTQTAQNYVEQYYMPLIGGTARAHVYLSSMQCPELTDKTARAIDDTVLLRVFVMAQRNNIQLLVKQSIWWAAFINVRDLD